jgi:hypothetical protein
MDTLISEETPRLANGAACGRRAFEVVGRPGAVAKVAGPA